jgi:DNA-binding protein HU-beta
VNLRNVRESGLFGEVPPPWVAGSSVLTVSVEHSHDEGGDVTKSEFVDQVADRADLNKKQASDAVDAVLSTIEETLKRGSDVTFSGFGKFHVAERGAREGRNPSTGEKIQIAASRVPRFTAGSGLKKSIKG